MVISEQWKVAAIAINTLTNSKSLALSVGLNAPTGGQLLIIAAFLSIYGFVFSFEILFSFYFNSSIIYYQLIIIISLDMLWNTSLNYQFFFVI